jgi:hypothetical protein
MAGTPMRIGSMEVFHMQFLASDLRTYVRAV